MDLDQFDTLARSLASTRSRRRLLGHLALLPVVGGLAGTCGQEQSQAKSRRGRGNHRGKATRRDSRAVAQAADCWRTGACLPGTGSNVSRCDLPGSTAFKNLDCTGCNASRANLRGADARNANFSKANLSGSCLVDADFTGATFAKTTNLANAIFCNTKMPDGSVNNSGCGAGTACCPTCTPTTCQNLGRDCGSYPDGCGGVLDCGTCGAGQVCATPGTCATPCTSSATCGSDCVCSALGDASGSVCRKNTSASCTGSGCAGCPQGWVCINTTGAGCPGDIGCAKVCA